MKNWRVATMVAGVLLGGFALSMGLIQGWLPTPAFVGGGILFAGACALAESLKIARQPAEERKQKKWIGFVLFFVSGVGLMIAGVLTMLDR